MNFSQYIIYTADILSRSVQQPPYDTAVYLDYTRLNFSRMNRWTKTLELNEELAEVVRSINRPQSWIIIAEPWCGDAAPALPFIVALSEINPLVQYSIQLRDEEPFLINQYLTDGGKSIPKLIARDSEGKDLFVWGPRPVSAQLFMDKLSAEGADKMNIVAQLQSWYNTDRGACMQQELLGLFRKYLVNSILV